MNIPDITAMIVNLAKSLQEVDYLIRAVGYVIGILFMIKAVSKFKKIGDARARSSSSEKMFVPVVYTLMSMILIYSPTAINILSNTTFGANNILQYSDYSSVDTVTAVKFLVQVIGTIWFIRGCVLLAQASEPGVQHGPKGFVFLLAGIIAMNYSLTVDAITYIIKHITELSITFKKMIGM